MVSSARTTPITAAETELPIERIGVLGLLAEAVSDWGTAPMMRAVAPWAKPTPVLQTMVTASRLQVDRS